MVAILSSHRALSRCVALIIDDVSSLCVLLLDLLSASSPGQTDQLCGSAMHAATNKTTTQIPVYLDQLLSQYLIWSDHKKPE